MKNFHLDTSKNFWFCGSQTLLKPVLSLQYFNFQLGSVKFYSFSSKSHLTMVYKKCKTIYLKVSSKVNWVPSIQQLQTTKQQL